MRRQTTLAVLLALLAGLVLATVLTGRGVTCEEWQDRYNEASRQAQGGVLTNVNEGPVAERLRELENQRPDGCTTPEV